MHTELVQCTLLETVKSATESRILTSTPFTPKQIAEALLVSESSIKRWCDQGLIASEKTAGGHRRIGLEALNAFLSSQKRSLPNPGALGLSEQPNHVLRPSEVVESATANEFTQALLDCDEARCRLIVQKAYAAKSNIASLTEDFFVPALQAIGDAWECDNLEVYYERRACNICAQLLGELAKHLPPVSAKDPVAIGCSPSGDNYQLSTRLVELVLRDVGWHATSLGHNMPLTSLAAAVIEFEPKLVWLSASSIDDRSQFVEDFNLFASSLPGDVMLLVGGRALDDQTRPQLNYTAHCDNLHQLADLASAMRHRAVSSTQSDN